MEPTIMPAATSSSFFSDNAGIIGTFFVGSFLFFGFVVLLWILALVDILKSEFKESNNKVIWLILTFLLPLLGPILYFLIGRKQVKKGSGISLKVCCTVLLFFIWYPLGVVLMWFWTNWPRWIKIVITIIGVLLAGFTLWGKYISPYR